MQFISKTITAQVLYSVQVFYASFSFLNLTLQFVCISRLLIFNDINAIEQKQGFNYCSVFNSLFNKIMQKNNNLQNFNLLMQDQQVTPQKPQQLKDDFIEQSQIENNLIQHNNSSAQKSLHQIIEPKEESSLQESSDKSISLQEFNFKMIRSNEYENSQLQCKIPTNQSLNLLDQLLRQDASLLQNTFSVSQNEEGSLIFPLKLKNMHQNSKLMKSSQHQDEKCFTSSKQCSISIKEYFEGHSLSLKLTSIQLVPDSSNSNSSHNKDCKFVKVLLNKKNIHTNPEAFLEYIDLIDPTKLEYLLEIFKQFIHVIRCYKTIPQMEFGLKNRQFKGIKEYLHLNRIPVILDKFFNYKWNNVLILNLVLCQIDDNKWKTLVKHANRFEVLHMMNIQQNDIYTVSQGDVQAFTTLSYIYFQFNPLSRKSLQYLQNLSNTSSTIKINYKFKGLPLQTNRDHPKSQIRIAFANFYKKKFEVKTYEDINQKK